ncbi:MAG: lipopolysaccharide biosynthesis protein, partial [Nevskiales bacterium]
MLTLVYLVTYPYMVSRLGSEQFALWVLALAFGQTLPVLDMGIAGALMKQVPQHCSRGERERILQLGSTATALLLAIGSLCALCSGLARPWLVEWLRIPTDLQAEMRWLLAGIACVFLINLIAASWSAILIGLQRADLSNGIYTWTAAVHAAGVFVALGNGYGLAGLLANAGVMALQWLLLTRLFLRRQLPGFGFSVGQVNRADARSLLGYGFKVQLAGAGGFFTIPAIKFILSRYVSLASVSFFELASGISLQLRSAFLQAAIPLTPAAAQLHATGEFAEMKRLYRSSFRLLFLSTLPAFSLGAVLAPGFVAFWLGQPNQAVATTLSLLLLGWFINTLTLPAYFMLQGRGLARYQAIFASLQLLCAIVFGHVLATAGGYYGAVLG